VQVRLKLLPLLLEWDVRQGPAASLALPRQVQFQPTGIRKVSSRGVDNGGNARVPARQQYGWRYVLLVERLQQQQHGQQAAQQDGQHEAQKARTAAAAAAAAAGAGQACGTEAEDLAIDLCWLAGTARSKPTKQAPFTPAESAAAAGSAGGTPSASTAAAAAAPPQQPQQQLSGGGTLSGLDGSGQCAAHYEDEPNLATQAPLQAAVTPSKQQPARQPPGSLQFSEHRSLRCSLMDATWPQLVARFR
jgi:hypothetical protein